MYSLIKDFDLKIKELWQKALNAVTKKSDGAGVWAQVARATIWSTNHYTTPSLFDGLLQEFSYKEVLITKLKH